MKAHFILASLATLALAGCGAVPVEKETTRPTANVSTVTDPVDLVSLDYAIVDRCNSPRRAADLVVRVPGTQSNVGKAYRRAGCVTLAVYQSEKGPMSYDFSHWQYAIGEYPARDVIESYSANEIVIRRRDFDLTDLTAVAVAAVAKEVG